MKKLLTVPFAFYFLLLVFFNLSDLGALQTQTCHESCLIEEESVDFVLGSGGGESTGSPLIHNDDARADQSPNPYFR